MLPSSQLVILWVVSGGLWSDLDRSCQNVECHEANVIKGGLALLEAANILVLNSLTVITFFKKMSHCYNVRGCVFPRISCYCTIALFNRAYLLSILRVVIKKKIGLYAVHCAV